MTEGVVLTAAHCVKGLGGFAILMFTIIIISIIIISITIVKRIVIKHQPKNGKPAEAEQLVVRCGEWNTHHENEPLKHQVFFLFLFPPDYSPCTLIHKVFLIPNQKLLSPGKESAFGYIFFIATTFKINTPGKEGGNSGETSGVPVLRALLQLRSPLS